MLGRRLPRTVPIPHHLLSPLCPVFRSSIRVANWKDELEKRCASDSDCATGFCGWDFKCGNKKTNGEGCTEDDDCNSGSCQMFKCKDKKPKGSWCGSDDDCQSGDCSWMKKCKDPEEP